MIFANYPGMIAAIVMLVIIAGFFFWRFIVRKFKSQSSNI